MFQIHAIPIFSDNYVWCLVDPDKNAIVIDPGCGNSIIQYIETHKLKLKAILVTHHHPDHIGGVAALKAKYPLRVFGYQDAALNFLDERFKDNECFELLNIKFKVLEVPGHTLDHIAFFAEIPISSSESDSAHQSDTTPCLFCGDTLFSGGCGRLFEGTAEQMHTSLSKILTLPGNSRVYCTHEYTLSNLNFARTLMPNNRKLLDYTVRCQQLRDNNKPTLPTSIALELEINPFLRTYDNELIESLQKSGLLEQSDNPVEVFRATRKAKDRF